VQGWSVMLQQVVFDHHIGRRGGAYASYSSLVPLHLLHMHRIF
jgi:hypothetical protein